MTRNTLLHKSATDTNKKDLHSKCHNRLRHSILTVHLKKKEKQKDKQIIEIVQNLNQNILFLRPLCSGVLEQGTES